MRFLHALLIAALALACMPAHGQSWDFEAPAVPPEFTNDAVSPWSITTSAARAGTRSLRSGAIPHGGSTQIGLRVTSLSGAVLSFWYRVDAEAGWDRLELRVNDQVYATYNAEYGTPWRHVTIELEAGAQAIGWRYRKDGSVSVGNDAVWLDDVAVSVAAPPEGVTVEFGWPSATIDTSGPARVVAADATGDGVADLIGMSQRESYSYVRGFWWIAQWGESGLQTRHISRGYTEFLHDIAVFDDPTGGRRLLVVMDDRVHVHSLPDRALVLERTLPPGTRRAKVADLDGDGELELVVMRVAYSSSVAPIAVYPLAAGPAMWQYTPTTYVSPADIEIGDFTDDAGLEIVAASESWGVVLTAQGAVAWDHPLGFGSDVAGGNFDADPEAEFVVLQNGSLEMHDARLRSPIWGIANAGTGTIAARDLDGDGLHEATLASPSYGTRLRAFSPVTRQVVAQTPDASHRVDEVAIGDLDGDGSLELAGTSMSYYEPRLSVMRFGAASPDWTSPPGLRPALRDVWLADVDGDGRPEVVHADSLGLMVSDSETFALVRRISVNPTSATNDFVRGVETGQTDGDPAPEALVVVSDNYWQSPRRLDVYDLASGLRQASVPLVGLTSGAAQQPHLVDAGRIWLVDGDRLAEVALSDGTATWSSVSLGGESVTLSVANLDADPQLEAVARGGNNVVFFDTLTRLVEWIAPIPSAISMKVDATTRTVAVASLDSVRILDLETRQVRLVHTQPAQTASLRDAWVVRPGVRPYVVIVRGDHTHLLVDLEGRAYALESPYGIGFGAATGAVPYLVASGRASMFGVSDYAVHRYDLSVETTTLFGDGFE